MAGKLQNADIKSLMELQALGADKPQLLNTDKMYSPKSAEVLETTLRKNNFSATSDPLPTNDSSENYEVGSMWVNTDSDKSYICVDNSVGAAVWIQGGSGVGDAESLFNIRIDEIQLSDIDLTGQNADFDGGGTITASSLSISETEADLLVEEAVIKYAPGANGQNDYFGFTRSLVRAGRGKNIGFLFNYKTDDTYVNGDVRFSVKQKDGSLAGTIEYFDLPKFYSSNREGELYKNYTYVAADCTELEVGFQNTSTTTTIEFYASNISFSQSAFTFQEVFNSSEWEEYTPSWGSGLGTVTLGKTFWKRSGDSMEVIGFGQTGSVTANSAYVSLPTGRQIDANKLSRVNAVAEQGQLVGSWGGNDTNGHGHMLTATNTDDTVVYFSGNNNSNGQIFVTNAFNGVIGGSVFFSFKFKVPILGWSETASHFLTPAKTNLSDWTPYIPATQGLGVVTDVEFWWKQVGDTLHIKGNLVTGTPNGDQARINFPSGLISDPLKVDNNIELAGYAARFSTGSQQIELVGAEPSVNYFVFCQRNGTFAFSNRLTGTQLIGVGEQMSIDAKVPIQGWSGLSQFLAAIPQVKIATDGTEYDTYKLRDGKKVYARTWRLSGNISTDTLIATIDTGLIPLNSHNFTGGLYLLSSYPSYQIGASNNSFCYYDDSNGQITLTANGRTVYAGTEITIEYTY